MMHLTPDQLEKFETIKWLTDPLGARGSGRTQLLAMAYIQHSISYRCWVTVVNHGMGHHPMAITELLDRIKYLIPEKYNLKIKSLNSRMPSILVEPIPDKNDIIKQYTSPWGD